MNHFFTLTFLFIAISISMSVQGQNTVPNSFNQTNQSFHQKTFSSNGDHSCGFQPTQQQIDALENNPKFRETERWFLQNYHARSLQPIDYVPIKAHIVRTSGGTGGLTVAELTAAIANMNTFYINANMQFYLCDGIHYIDDNTYYDFNQTQEAALHAAHGVANLINIYFCNSVTSSGGSSLCGYAYFPGGPDVIMMANNCATNGSTLPHEMGHFFSLYHTHGTTNGTLTDELVDASNCVGAGDRVCDTEADPQLGNGNVTAACVYNNTAPYTGGVTVDANGDPFVPNPNNIMSYARKACRTLFTPGQYARIYSAYSTSRNYFTCPTFNVDFTATPTSSCSTPLTVNFTDNSIGATSWQWDVDGDNVVDYTSQNPTHIYNVAGSYDVRLTISNGTETIFKTKTTYINVGGVGSVPYNEDFESFNSASNATGLGNGWTSTPSNTTADFRWNADNGGTPSNNTGPNVDNTLGTAAGHYMFTEGSSGAANDVTELISPCIDLNATAPLLEFSYHMFGAAMGALHVDIYSGGAWINDITPVITGQQHAAQGDAYSSRQVSLTAYSGQVVQIRFRAVRAGSWSTDMAIDDITIINNSTAPEISFTASTSTQQESNINGSVGCRGYVDLTIPVQIANAPTGDAIVTFNLGGTASNNYDYQILTPSVTFTNGSAVNQNLSVRVWDDANEENDETLILTYTISGATNAVPAVGDQTHTLTIQDNDLLPSELGASTTILTEDFEGGVLPVGWSRTQAGGSAGMVIDIVANHNSGNFTIPATNASNVACSNDDVCNCDMSVDYLVTPSMDLSASVAATLTFDAYHPGNWGSNAYVKVSTASATGPWTTEMTLASNLANWQNGLSVDLTAYAGNATVWVAFHHDDAGAWADGLAVDNVQIDAVGNTAEVSTVLGSTNQLYFGPNATVYYYDAGGNIMAKLVNTSAWDYGCTTIDIDRAGTGAVAYDDNNVLYYAAQKTMLITPTNNNPAGTYDITLYYTDNEITTWEATSTNVRANLNIRKTGGASSNITPAAPLANGNTNYDGTGPSRVVYSSSDYTISASFNNGFSGFAIGDPPPPIVLDAKIIEFDGEKISDQHNLMTWLTGAEEDNDFFELERSHDGLSFETIGQVESRGNTTEKQNYKFSDKDIQTLDLCYYRLRQVGVTGTVDYSNVIAIKGTDKEVTNFSVFPNPSKDVFNILFESTNEATIPLQIFNGIGQLVFEKDISSKKGKNSYRVDLSEFSSGVYFLKMKPESSLSAYTETIIKQ